MPPDAGPSFFLAPSADGTNHATYVLIINIIILTNVLTEALTKCTFYQHSEIPYV